MKDPGLGPWAGIRAYEARFRGAGWMTSGCWKPGGNAWGDRGPGRQRPGDHHKPGGNARCTGTGAGPRSYGGRGYGPGTGWSQHGNGLRPRLGARDGSGDFCTVQGAVDFVPENNTTPRTIFIRKGVYTEIVYVAKKHALSFVGEDRKQSVIGYANNAKFNPSSDNHTYHRGVFLASA